MDYYPRRYNPAFRPDYVSGRMYPSAISDLPADPTASATDQSSAYIVNKRYKYLGIILIFLALATLAVECANVAETVIIFNVTSRANSPGGFENGPLAQMPYILTWIVPGIWGSIAVIFTGFLAIRAAGKASVKIRFFALFCSLSAIVFTPAIIAISIAEIMVYPNYDDWKNYLYQNKACYTFDDSSTLICPKFVLPLVVVILGGLMFYLTAMITIMLCCCPIQTDATKAGGGGFAGITPIVPAATAVAGYPATTPYGAGAYAGGVYGGQGNYPALPSVGVARRPGYYGSLPPPASMYSPMNPNMNFLSSYNPGNLRPMTTSGFGYAPAYNSGFGGASGGFGMPSFGASGGFGMPSYGASGGFGLPSFGMMGSRPTTYPPYGTMPSLGAFGPVEPNPAYRYMYN